MRNYLVIAIALILVGCARNGHGIWDGDGGPIMLVNLIMTNFMVRAP